MTGAEGAAAAVMAAVVALIAWDLFGRATVRALWRRLRRLWR